MLSNLGRRLLRCICASRCIKDVQSNLLSSVRKVDLDLEIQDRLETLANCLSAVLVDVVNVNENTQHRAIRGELLQGVVDVVEEMGVDELHLDDVLIVALELVSILQEFWELVLLKEFGLIFVKLLQQKNALLKFLVEL